MENMRVIGTENNKPVFIQKSLLDMAYDNDTFGIIVVKAFKIKIDTGGK